MEYNPEAPVVIKFENTEVELHRDRTAAYTFREIGHRALNHLWLTDTDESGQEYGTYIWFNNFGVNDEQREENFSATIQAMASYQYPLHLNLVEPTEFDVNNYIEHEFRDL